MLRLVRITGSVLAIAGVIGLVFAPFIGESFFESLWGVEPIAYIGAILVMAGLGSVSISYFISHNAARKTTRETVGDGEIAERWSQTTQQYFELFQHDLGRPLTRILGRERELRAILQSSDTELDSPLEELLDEIEEQAPSFRLMMSNIQVLVQLGAPQQPLLLQPVEPSELVRRVVGRYTSVATASGKEITWWAEPSEFGIVHANGAAIEHIVTNLVDNAIRFATARVEIKLTKNPSHFFIRVWDDGPGIATQYVPHIYDRGWTPEAARHQEKSSSGLGLFIGQTLANHYKGDLVIETVAEPDPHHHTAFLLSLPLEGDR